MSRTKTKYKRTFHEVHTSEDGDNWRANRPTFEDTPEGLKAANKAAQDAATNTRHVRVAHVTKQVTVLKVLDNPKILAKRQIEKLLADGSRAIAGIPGLMCNEGSYIGFGETGVSRTPPHVTVSFHAASVLGKFPPRVKDAPGGGPARVEYNAKAKELRTAALDQACAKLKEAGVWFTQRSDGEIMLRPSK